MTIKFSSLILLFFFNSFMVRSQEKAETLPASFKIVGYYFLNSALRDTVHADSTYLFLDKITHLNIAFINPDSNGVFQQDYAIDTLIKKAHIKNVKVLASIAGGEPHPYYKALLQKNNRKAFVNNLISLMQRYDLDGIDVDIEGSDIDENYEKFVIELAGAIKQNKKLITAAISTAYKDQLSNKALKQFDFVSIMSYDLTGPWEPGNPGNHSPFSMAVDDLDYWHRQRNIPQDKIVLGLPFYGYGFGALDSPVVSMDYNQIITSYPESKSLDTLMLPGNITMYHNGTNTIKRKTELAMVKAGGVMIWQILGDAPGENSLLATIYKAVHEKEKALQ